jgi:hypothetical protein
MRAIVISPASRSVETVDVATVDDIKAIVGYDTLESDAVGTQGDRLYFDEECFLRGTSGRFQIDTVIPVAGKGVIVGSADGGATLRDAVTDLEDLRHRLRYL